jgi:hypothetical protein
MEEKCEKYKDDPYADCHKDFCRCVVEAMKIARKNKRDRAVKASINFLVKNKIPFKPTKTENIVKTEYWGEVFYISLKTFKFKKEGEKTWLEKKKKLFKTKSIVNFGKHKGLTFGEVLEKDKNYIVWVNDKTDVLLDNTFQIFNLTK